MADPRCIVTAPLPVARGLGFRELATVVAADALVRRAWAVGRAAELIVPTLAGDLAGHYAFEKELAREGHDRSSVKADELAVRAAAFDEGRRLAAAELFARLSVVADLGVATTVTAAVSQAARTAFVKLYEEGLVEEAERVVARCPRCRTAVDAVDTERGEVEGERLTVRLTTSAGIDVDLRVFEPELLPGAVAVAVPDGSVAAGSSVIVPIADREVPVVVGSLHDAPCAVVPAHDGGDHELAMANGLPPIPVLDDDGAVLGDGPLAGLGRYAARAAARSLLEAEGVLVHAEPVPEVVWRCRCCGSVLVPQLGRHWFLRSADLEVAAADAVRHGSLSFSPPDARDAFLASVGVRREWCISTRVPGGVPLPAASCLECGKLTVDVDTSSSCGKCMGTLVPEPLFLHARFSAAIWPVVLGGWPGRRSSYPPEETLAVVSAADLSGWVLPAIALGLRLAGVSPFIGAVVHPWPDAEALDERPYVEGVLDPRVVRLALVAGTDDLEVASAAVEALDRPSTDDLDPAVVAEVTATGADGVAALDDGAPARAAGLLASALSGGVPADAADRLRALALPILGD